MIRPTRALAVLTVACATVACGGEDDSGGGDDFESTTCESTPARSTTRFAPTRHGRMISRRSTSRTVRTTRGARTAHEWTLADEGRSTGCSVVAGSEVLVVTVPGSGHFKAVFDSMQSRDLFIVSA